MFWSAFPRSPTRFHSRWKGFPEAVSYTHLDVYKRQVEYQKVSGDPGDHHEDERHELENGIFMMEDHECPHGDQDVYKRQQQM